MVKKQQGKPQMRKMRVLIGLIVVFVAAVGFAGWYTRYNKKTPVQAESKSTVVSTEQAEAVFRRYLVKSAALSGYFAKEELSGSGTKITHQAAYDATKKQVTTHTDMQCSAKINGVDVKQNVSVQTENVDTYVRLNSINGTFVDKDGHARKYDDVLANIKDVWYKAAQSDPVMQDQIDNGVFIFNSAIVAPGYDAQKIANFMINNRAYTYSQVKKQGANYVYSFRAIQTNFSEGVLKALIPGLKAPSDILNQIFSDTSNVDSMLTIAEDGTLVKEEGTHKNLCQDMLTAFTGADPKSMQMPSVLTVTSVPVSATNIHISPITGAKPAEAMAQDLINSTGTSI